MDEMGEGKRISVIMITHNRESFVENMICDVLNQTFKDFEYIIVDNCSIDRSGEIADLYAEKDPRIKVIHLEDEVSIGKARNEGVAHSTGEFITFVDDDDRIEKDFLESLRSMLSTEDIDFVMCGAVEKQGEEVSPQCAFDGTYSLNARQAIMALLNRKYMRAGMPAKLIRRKIIEKYPFKEDCRHEDIHTVYKYLSEIRKGVITGSPKYCVVRHGGNISYFTSDSSRITPEQLSEYLQAFKERTRFISEKFPDLKEIVQYSEWSYMISMCNKVVENKLYSCRGLLDEMRKELKRNKSLFCSMKYIKEFEKTWIEMYLED